MEEEQSSATPAPTTKDLPTSDSSNIHHNTRPMVSGIHTIEEIQLAHLTSTVSAAATQERAYQPAPSEDADAETGSEHSAKGLLKTTTSFIALSVSSIQ